MQDQGDGLHLVAFMNRALKTTKQRYLANERELPIVAYCSIQWQHYLEDYLGGVMVMTYHKPLTLLIRQQVLSQTQFRWVCLGLLQSINSKMKYQPREANIAANALSKRRPHHKENWEINKSTQRGDNRDPVALMTIQTSSAQLSTEELQQIKEAQKPNDELHEMYSQAKEQLQRKRFKISPQEILYHVNGD